MKDYYAIFDILGKRVLVLYLAENDYAPKIIKSLSETQQQKENQTDELPKTTN